MRILQNGCSIGDPGGNRTRDNLIKSPIALPLKVALCIIFRDFQTKKYKAIFRHILTVKGITRLNPAKLWLWAILLFPLPSHAEEMSGDVFGQLAWEATLGQFIHTEDDDDE